jgi:uncharacterized protein YecE (DUF72 family)
MNSNPDESERIWAVSERISYDWPERCASVKRYRLGCSGWSYTDWIGRFYSGECTPRTMLEEYAKHFDTVEINMSFYRLPFENIVRSWRSRTPDSFLFCPKLSRQITHLRRLRDSEELLSMFISRLSLLGEKLGPVLVQLPPSLKPNDTLLEEFLELLPTDCRFAVEFRNRDWFCPSIHSVLERYNVATCLIDSPKLVIDNEVSAPFAYVRWHGRSAWYSHDYSAGEINAWARVLSRLPVKEIFGFWNNDVNAYAPTNCLSMLKSLRRSASKRSMD